MGYSRMFTVKVNFNFLTYQSVWYVLKEIVSEPTIKNRLYFIGNENYDIFRTQPFPLGSCKTSYWK